MNSLDYAVAVISYIQK
ncbi:unnamed protein product, partial [Didymodactylos carnosus]